MLWAPNKSESDTNECYWQQHQQQQQQQQQQYEQQINHCSKSFLVPEDIPPPPPQPVLKNAFKRFACDRKQQQQQQHLQQHQQQTYFTNCSASFEQSYELQPQQQISQQQQPVAQQQQNGQHQQQPQQYRLHPHHHQYAQQHQKPAFLKEQLIQQPQHCQQHNHLQQPQLHQQQPQLHQQQPQLHQQQEQQQLQVPQQKHYHQHCLLRNQELQQQQKQQQQQQHQQLQQQQHSSQQQTPHHQQQQQQSHFKYHSNLFLKEQQQQSLIQSRKKIRRIRLLVSIFFGIVLLGVLITALVFIFKSSDGDTQMPIPKSGAIKLEDLLSGQLIARDFNATWSGTKLLYRDNATITELDVKTGKRTPLLHDEQHHYRAFEKSADGKFLLLSKNFIGNFRHSFTALYDIYDIASGQIYPLIYNGEQRLLWLVKWAPVGNALIFNYANNLYYKRSAQLDSDVVPITYDVNPHVLNGIPDWIYEEEVFSSNVAVWFNPNGTQLAFIRFDNSATNYMNLPEFGIPGDSRYQYPLYRPIPYPKAGSSNPRIRLITADLTRLAEHSDTHLTDVPVPSALNTEADYIITGVQWLNNDLMLSVWMNRIQNQFHIQIFNGLKRYELYSLESKTGWVNIFETPHKNRAGSVIALILPQRQGAADGLYQHLCLLPTRSPNADPEALTKGKFEVQSILYWDHDDDVIFFTANTELNPEMLHVYAIKAAAGQKSRCITCNLQQNGEGVKASYFTADFSSEDLVAIQTMGPAVPKTVIYEWKWTNNQVILSQLMDWENNTRLSTEIAKLSMPQTEIHSIPIAHGFTAKVLLQLPPNMDRSGKTKYPMLVEVYGGPDSNSVTNRWLLDWGVYLSSNRSVIYAKIDGRGSGLRGEKLSHSVYLKLGTLEIEDQINVTRQLQEKFAYIDAKHTGIWGWSYGGYAAAMALTADDRKVFNCAASVAPVTDWAYYDSIYTERYMSLPKFNELGYNNSRLTTRAHKLRGKKYLLIHGTLDDNVHYQQALVLAKSLERQNILFKQISYTDEDHSLANVRPHLYHSLDRFFGECFASESLLRDRN